MTTTTCGRPIRNTKRGTIAISPVRAVFVSATPWLVVTLSYARVV